MKTRKLEPFGRITLASLIMVLEKEKDTFDYLKKLRRGSCSCFSPFLYMGNYDLKLVQFQINDYLYFTKFIDFEITKN